jgi:hypothetical protein
MTSVIGALRLDDGLKTRAAIEKRTIGESPDGYAIVSALVLGGTILGFFLWVPNPMLGALVGGFSGVVLQYPAYRWAWGRAWRKALQARYYDYAFPIAAELTQEALIYEIGDERRVTKWRAVTDLFWNNGYWILIAQCRSYLIPQAAFADPSNERAFISEALSYMSEEARARSAGAVAFVARKDT